MSDQNPSIPPQKEIDIGLTPGDPGSVPLTPSPSPDQTFKRPMQERATDISKQVEGATTAESMLAEIIKMKEDTFIPWEEVTLPSQGYYYGGNLPGGVVKVRAMGIHAEKILSTARLAQTGQSIDYLFNHCVQLTEGFDQGELLVGDRVFLLYVLRGITHGNIYEFALKCPSCEHTSTHVYDLNELAATVKGPNYELGPEPFKVPLPYLSQAAKKNLWVKVRLLRGKDIAAMTNRVKFNKRVAKASGPRNVQVAIDQAVTENLALAVDGFGGDGLVGEVRDSARIKAFVDTLHSKDSSTIREFLKHNSPGIDTTVVVQCPECDQEIRTELPITEGFFRPASTGESGNARE